MISTVLLIHKYTAGVSTKTVPTSAKSQLRSTLLHTSTDCRSVLDQLYTHSTVRRSSIHGHMSSDLVSGVLTRLLNTWRDNCQKIAAWGKKS